MIRTLSAALALALALPVMDVDAREPRSKSVRAKFQRSNPCPSTANARGACPGYQVDHIRPLHRGGADATHNMQWLTIEQHREKTARETAQR